MFLFWVVPLLGWQPTFKLFLLKKPLQCHLRWDPMVEIDQSCSLEHKQQHIDFLAQELSPSTLSDQQRHRKWATTFAPLGDLVLSSYSHNKERLFSRGTESTFPHCSNGWMWMSQQALEENRLPLISNVMWYPDI